ncbi:MAG: O-antigen ligase family protein [Halothiobacillaceae bacterium]|nr:O-antigen ligase family protein [Halothiobacillaceae bacterium]
MSARWRAGADESARWLAVATAVAVPLPTAWVGITSGLFLLAWLAGGGFAAKGRALWAHPVARASLLLCGLFLLTVAWSSAPLKLALDGWGHYRELLLLPLMIAVLQTAPDPLRWGQRLLYGFLLSFAFALLWSYLQWFGWVPIYGGIGIYGAFSGHIGFSIMLAFVVFAGFRLALQDRPRRALWAVFALLALFNLFFVNTGRTGQLLFFFLVPLALFQLWRWRGLGLAMLVVAGLSGGLYALSPNFQERVTAAVGDIHAYQAGNSSTSWGLRLEFWNNSLQLAAEAPVLGQGMGGFVTAYTALADQQGLTGDHRADNPHNEYVMVLVQTGGLGLALLLWLFAVQWQQSRGQAIAQALWLLIVVGCLFNSFLLDNLEGHFWATMSAALYLRARAGTGGAQA